MIVDYLNALKSKGNFTYEQIASLSNIPEATIKNIMSGKTEDPRFDTISKLVYAMGGSLDEITDHKKEEEIEMKSIMVLKESYDARISDIKAETESRILDIKEHTRHHIEGLKSDKRKLWILSCSLITGVFLLIFIDLMFGNVGWIQY